jgi:hypothetical protein
MGVVLETVLAVITATTMLCIVTITNANRIPVHAAAVNIDPEIPQICTLRDNLNGWHPYT